jgi:hypothetical protein
MKIYKTAKYEKLAEYIDETKANEMIERIKKQVQHDKEKYNTVKSFITNLSHPDIQQMDYSDFFSIIKEEFVSLDDHDYLPHWVLKIEQITDKLWKEALSGQLPLNFTVSESPNDYESAYENDYESAYENDTYEAERIPPYVSPDPYSVEDRSF